MRKKFNTRQGRRSDAIVIIIRIVTNNSLLMSANIDVTMVAHFDVPNVDYNLLTLQNMDRVSRALWFVAMVEYATVHTPFTSSLSGSSTSCQMLNTAIIYYDIQLLYNFKLWITLHY